MLDCSGFQAELLHDSSNGFLGYLNALFLQGFPDFLASIQAPMVKKDPPNLLFKPLMTFASSAFFPSGPIIITALGDSKYGAHLRDTELEAVIVDEFIDQRRSFAK
ncbi:hypothetical protein QJ48_24730 [Paenibacillus sp. A3]|nr:hypothetical protein QJ48_24730 [Paenibacillus sp. A3]